LPDRPSGRGRLDGSRSVGRVGLAIAAYPDGPQAALWFSAAPREARASLLDLICAPVGAWTRSWLAHILPEAGADAERVFQLLTS